MILRATSRDVAREEGIGRDEAVPEDPESELGGEAASSVARHTDPMPPLPTSAISR